MATTEPAPAPGAAREALRRAVPPMVVAAGAWVIGAQHLAIAALVAALALTVLGLVAPSGAAALDRGVRRGAERIGDILAPVVLTIVWALLVLPIWAVSTAVRRARRRPILAAPGWRKLHTDPTASGSWTFEAPLGDAPRGSLLLRLASLVVAVLVGVAAAAHLWPEATVDRERAAPVVYRPQVYEPGAQEQLVAYAFADEPWGDEALTDSAKTSATPDPILGWRGRDLRTRYVNIVDGRRVSYQPEDPTLTVWFFGGSTMFGDGQRDEHTIPSEIARLAEADGVSIRAVNFGAGSYNNFQETMAFLDALSREDPPDVAVFYDGANEWATALERLNYGELDPDRVYFQAASDEERAERQARAPEMTLDEAEQRELAIELAAEQYRRGAEIAQWAAAANDVELLHVWQPGLWSTPVRPFAQPLLDAWGFDQASLDDLDEMMTEMRERSGVDPIDLSGALAEVDRPTFYDYMHTNELGARVIAEQLYVHLRPSLGLD